MTGSTGLAGSSTNKYEAFHAALTEGILRCFYRVYNQLRYGFLEKVYVSALKYELVKNGYKEGTQKKIEVFYGGKRVCEYYEDLVVNDLVALELKLLRAFVMSMQSNCWIIYGLPKVKLGFF